MVRKRRRFKKKRNVSDSRKESDAVQDWEDESSDEGTSSRGKWTKEGGERESSHSQNNTHIHRERERE